MSVCERMVSICMTFFDLVWISINGDINGVLGHNSALFGYGVPGTIWANEMNISI